MRAFILLLALAPCYSSVQAPPLHFRIQRVSTETYESVEAFDANGDGKPDLVSGGFWYEGPAFTKRHFIGEVKRFEEYYDDFSTIPLDINGDGKLDFVTGGWWGNTVRWRENPGNSDKQWAEHVIAECGNVETTRAWDVDGDGIPEIVPNNPGHPFKFFRLNRDANGKGIGTFTEHQIYPTQGHGLGFGDLNGDGRGDFILAEGWLESPAKPLTDKWIWHQDFKLGDVSIPILVVDVNGDKRADLIAGKAHDYGLDWYEQTPDHQWKKHSIDPQNSQFHALYWADLDGDSKPELITGKRYRAHNDGDPGVNDDYGLYYYQWNGEQFVKQIIQYGPKGTGKGAGIYFAVTDLNSDQRPDLAVAGKDGLWVFFNEKPAP